MKPMLVSVWVSLLPMGLFWGGWAGAAELPAILEWKQPVTLGFFQSGVVREVWVSPGQEVRQGAELVRLDQRVLQPAVQAAQARLKATRLDQQEARRELERSRELYENTLVAIHEVNLAEAAEAHAQAELQAARRDLARTRTRLEYSTLSAPFPARVVAVHVVAGQAVNSRERVQPIIDLIDAQGLWASTRISAALAQGLEVGQVLEVRVAGKSYSGQVRESGYRAMPDGGWRLVVDLPRALQRGLRAGMPATVTVPEGP